MDWRIKGFHDISLPFTTAPSTVMHIDLNSCFASIEQQANPLLRGKPIAVAAYNSPGGCILAPSIEAKRLGIKTGMRVKEGKLLCPSLYVLAPDANKYRVVHLKFRNILKDYTYEFYPKSIDEFVLHLDKYPAYRQGLKLVAQEIKDRIKKEIGEWITVSVGIGPNRFLAKTASSLHKPDGLDEINFKNAEEIYAQLTLTDLNGINTRNEARLNRMGIKTPIEMYQAPLWRLKAAFHSVLGFYWYTRLRGWEIDAVEFGRKSYGNSYALPHSDGDFTKLLPILEKLTEKATGRMRSAGYRTRGVSLSLLFREWDWWQHSYTLKRELFDARDIYKVAKYMLLTCPKKKPVHTLAVSCFNLTDSKKLQLDLFEDILKKKELVAAIDDINDRWGRFVISSARMLNMEGHVHDRIAFGQGGVRDL